MTQAERADFSAKLLRDNAVELRFPIDLYGGGMDRLGARMGRRSLEDALRGMSENLRRQEMMADFVVSEADASGVFFEDRVTLPALERKLPGLDERVFLPRPKNSPTFVGDTDAPTHFTPPEPVRFEKLPLDEKFEHVCKAIKYKPDWRFHIERAPWFAGYKDGAGFALKVTQNVADRDTGREMPLTFTKLPKSAEFDADASAARVTRYVYDVIVEFEMHEAAEFFKVNGDRVFDPHDPTKRIPGYAV